MIKASITDPKNPLIVMGLTEGNIERLKDGQPIRTAIRSFGVDLPGLICVFYGRTEADIEHEFRKYKLIGPATRVETDERPRTEAEIRDRHDKILICTVGLPRSGKTTWARKQVHPVVNPDAIRLAIHGQKFIPEAEPFVWATAKAMVRALFLAGHRTVILDATNTTRKRRDEWRSTEWATFFRCFFESVDTCKERAVSDGRQDLVEVIDRMAVQFEPRGDDEEPWP